ncbi:MAG: hypothetical protein CMH26_06720 [Micavibrio sp.]|nr:hypothetical protein [Micavibrio sp.]|tara:strand:+ start:201 stop:767 length:567 start_codon:yes stop_codon:yes gene_type:complete
MELILSIILGIVFGFALNRAGATNPQNIINMLRLQDLHLMKAILFAIGLSSALLFILLAINYIDPAHISVKTAYIGVIVGGLLLGIGFAIAGYCPGTGLASIATGRKDALFFTLGGLLGALAFTLLYGWLKETTPLFNEIAGGSVSLANTQNEKYAHLIDMNPTLIGVGIGIAFMAIATLLPKSIVKN